MKKIILFIAPILLLSVISCRNEIKKPKTSDEILEMASKAPGLNAGTENYTISIPDGWTTQDTIMKNIKFHFILPPAENDVFRVNVNIINEDMSGLATEEYVQTTVKNMKSLMPQFTLKEQGEFPVSDTKGSFIHYTGQQNNIQLEGILYIIPHNGIAYLMTGMTAAGNMNKYKPTFDKIAQSFKFKD